MRGGENTNLECIIVMLSFRADSLMIINGVIVVMVDGVKKV